MTIAALDPYRPDNSLLHRCDARIKTGLALGFILAAALTPPRAWPVWMVLLALALVAVILAELRASFALARVALALPLVLAALPLLFTVAGPPLWTLPWGWTATQTGALRVASVALKAGLSVLVAVTLTATTPFTEVLAALRGWGLPPLLVAILALTWRYLFVLGEEAQRLLRARAARSGRAAGAPGGSLIWRARVTGGLAGNLLLRGTERAERTYGAMAARGYDGAPRVLARSPLTAGGRAALGLGLTALALLTLAGLLLWG